DDFLGLGQGVGKFVGVLAAGLCEVGLAAATAADNGGDVANPIAGADPLIDQIARDTGNEDDLAIAFGRREEDGAGARFFSNLIDKLPHQVRVGARRFGHNDRYALYILGFGQQGVSREIAGGSATGDLALEVVDFGEH